MRGQSSALFGPDATFTSLPPLFCLTTPTAFSTQSSKRSNKPIGIPNPTPSATIPSIPAPLLLLILLLLLQMCQLRRILGDTAIGHHTPIDIDIKTPVGIIPIPKPNPSSPELDNLVLGRLGLALRPPVHHALAALLGFRRFACLACCCPCP